MTKPITSGLKTTIPVLLLALTLGGCAGKMQPAEGTLSTRDLNEQLVMATLWMQAAAEFRALSYQAFNIATVNLDAFLGAYTGSKPVAVIVDADETVLDNSAYEAFLIGQDFGYSSATWDPWMAAAQAKAMPGAREFLDFAAAQGVEVFYVSNRKMVGYEGTKKNLESLGFPFVDDKHLLLRTDSSDKQGRRDRVAADYEVALLLGDNLNDFSSDFAKKTVQQRFAETDKLRGKWGTRFIVLPNPVYGDWEGAVYSENWGASPAEKDRMRKSLLEKWQYTVPK
ncbi:MAG: 5'-nucleotidase, lipoprotein e(P4) family [Desulfofustis sp.]|jgi:5'-nucleotidase (lipoprotein e(P4) family)|nr:5'-nucleotidase, lipoprotein e(P4) family [Desulfofustis sp.]